MFIILLLISIILLIYGIVCIACASDSCSSDEGIIVSGALIGIGAGLILLIMSIMGFCGSFDNKPETQVAVTTTDSTQVQVKPDSIYAIQYVVSYKDENGVWCGNNVKLLGKTEKNIGDTIIINIK